MIILQRFALIFLVVFTTIQCRPRDNEVLDQKVRYDNYRVYKIFPADEEQLNILNNLKLNDDFSIWMSSKSADNSSIQLDVMVEPSKNLELRNMLDKESINYELKIENVQKLIDDEIVSNYQNEKDAFDWKSYHTLDEINDWIEELTQLKVLTKFSIGQSYEGREIYGVKISYKSGNPGIFIESNIHAREWITSATATYLINELLTSDNEDIRNMAETIDWYIIPVLNVDGFVYTHEKDRMWRKTRKPNKNSNCVGTDGNRNFDSHWMENGGASNNPCDETYAGSHAFSEPEIEALAKYYKSIKDKISIYLSFHSYGQLLLSPYGHTAKEFPPNYNQMLDVAGETVRAIKKRYQTSYVYGSTAAVLYTASGVSPDWVYNKHGIKLAYTFEFRDTGNYGFVLPADQIIPNSEEVIDGLLAMIKIARDIKLLE